MTSKDLKGIVVERLGSQSELARLMNISKYAVSKYFIGTRMPSVPTMRLMARKLNVKFLDIVDAFYGPDDALFSPDHNV